MFIYQQVEIYDIKDGSYEELERIFDKLIKQRQSFSCA
jgi:uncharacterized protein YfkK (UPF0435 family)